MGTLIDRTGRTFGRLTVLERAPNGTYGVTWQCQCACGSRVTLSAQQLVKQLSCGCWRREASAARLTKHGLRSTPEYVVWKDMRARCNNPNATDRSRYGGRGIRVCDRWSSFAAFLADMGERPPGMTIERIDNSLGYQPGNCRWATTAEQNRNKRSNRYVTICGERLLIIDACARYGIRHRSVWARRSQNRLTLTEAFFDFLERVLCSV